MACTMVAANCGLLCKVNAGGTLHFLRRTAYASVNHTSGRHNRWSTRA
jgi:hypothetical protein